MPRADARTAGAARLPGPGEPDVIVDVIFEEGLLYLAVANIGPQPAVDVSVAFAKPVFGLDGEREISALPLFRGITFLAPQKSIRTFLDSCASYFARRGNPAILKVTITYYNRAGECYACTIRHDLRIYRELGYVRR